MKLKARYLMELSEPVLTEAQLEDARQALERNPALTAAAARRKLGSRDDRWWTVVAGLLIVAVMVVYSLGWNVAAVVAIALLCAFMAFVLVRTLYKRNLLRHTPREISAGRCTDALFHRALGLPFEAKELNGLLDDGAVAALGAELRDRIDELAARNAVAAEKLTLRVDTQVTSVENVADGHARIPVIVTMDAGSPESGRIEAIFEYAPAFVLSSTGDCMLACQRPHIAATLRRDPDRQEERPDEVKFERCAHCGVPVSRRYLEDTGGICPHCKEKADPTAD